MPPNTTENDNHGMSQTWTDFIIEWRGFISNVNGVLVVEDGVQLGLQLVADSFLGHHRQRHVLADA